MRLTSSLRVAADVPRLLRHPHASREQIVAFQERRLRELVQHAYENVPYYRRLFDEAAVNPDDIRSLADLERIPITTKATLQSLGGSDMLARGLAKSDLIERETNGSTGIPLTVYRARVEQVIPTLFLWRVRRELGLRRGLRVTFLTKFGPKPRSKSLLRRIRTRLQQSIGIQSWTRVESTAPMDQVAMRVRESKPDVIGGYAGVLSRLAREFDDGQTEVRPRLIISVAEVLTQAMRARIEKAFDTKVRDTYAAYELGIIAWECPQGGNYHVCDDNVIVEIEGKDSDSGELIGTNLHFTAMPMIRYRLGDIVTRGPDRCACGSPFTTLSAIQGRMNDYFPLPDGRLLHPYRIGTAVWKASFEWMNQYQVIQERRDRVVMKIVARRNPAPDEITALESAVNAVLGSDVEFVTQLVDDIDDEVNGKFRIYRSFVDSDYSM